MNFEQAIPRIVGVLDSAGVRYALIGGLAMAFRGAQRATFDMDFILLLEDLKAAHAALESLGYRREFHSENVSQYGSADAVLGRIDILHAFRGPTLGMLDRAERIRWDDDTTLPVVHLEDLVGLKIQASVNDPSRYHRDWSDIHMLVRGAGLTGAAVDWELIEDYLAIFGLESKIQELKQSYGQAH
jgi:hypothetical protein